MGTVLELLDALNTVDIVEDCVTVTNNVSEEYARMNAAQMNQGKNREGRPIGKYKSMSYARMKADMNTFLSGRVPYNVDLKLTGAFQKGLKMEIGNTMYLDVWSTDGKAMRLENLYGSEIFGLDDENRGTFVGGYLQPEFEKMITAKTGLTFN